jgi:hypothetical protein
MEDAPRAPLNTREFVARWQGIIEEHFVDKLADSLGHLAAARPGGPMLEQEQCRMMAHHVVQALYVAASSSGGVPDAVQYLVQVAAEGEGIQGTA